MNIDKIFVSEVDDEPGEIVSIIDDQEDDGIKPEDVIKENINKANKILDITLDAISRGMMNPRIVEAAIKAVESVTSAAMALNNCEKLDLDRGLFQLREKELEIKMKQLQSQKSIGTNIIVTTRENIMKALKHNDQKVIDVEYKEQ